MAVFAECNSLSIPFSFVASVSGFYSAFAGKYPGVQFLRGENMPLVCYSCPALEQQIPLNSLMDGLKEGRSCLKCGWFSSNVCNNDHALDNRDRILILHVLTGGEAWNIQEYHTGTATAQL